MIRSHQHRTESSMQHKTKWTITYTSGATRLVADEQTARTEALSNPNVVGIRAPIYA